MQAFIDEYDFVGEKNYSYRVEYSKLLLGVPDN
jgi:hypothetical protein